VIAGWMVTSALIFLLGILGHLSETSSTIFGTKYHFDVQGMPHVVQEAVAETNGGEAE